MKYERKPAYDGRSIDVTLHKAETPIFRRRHPGLAGIALGTAVAVTPILGSAQGVLERAEGLLDQLKADIKGELQDLREDVREEVAYLLGMESWIYGYPLVLMDVTRRCSRPHPHPTRKGPQRRLINWPRCRTMSAPISRMSCISLEGRYA